MSFGIADTYFDYFSIAITVGGIVPTTVDFQATFEKLKAILKPYEAKLYVVHDTARGYYLDTHYVMKNKQRLFFAAVRAGKAYVSFHLMPVYASSDLSKGISRELKKRKASHASTLRLLTKSCSRSWRN